MKKKKKKLFVELGTSGTCREVTLGKILEDLGDFHEVFGPEKEGCAQEACCPPSHPMPQVTVNTTRSSSYDPDQDFSSLALWTFRAR